MNIPHFSWVWLLVVYLWAVGGKGWTIGYEFSQRRRMKRPARIIAYLGWPAFSAVSVVGEWYAQLFPKSED